MIPVAEEHQRSSAKNLFTFASEKNIRENHLWFSIFMRSERSRFTRVQRVSCCFALLYLSMLCSAMWYQTVPEDIPGGFRLKHIFRLRIQTNLFYRLGSVLSY